MKALQHPYQSWQRHFRFGIGAITLAILVIITFLIAVKYVYLGCDSINNYIHIWYISDHLYDSGWFTARIPWLEGGQALTYPYGFATWTLTAVIYPLFGDYTVTWMMVLGFILMLLVVYRTRLRGHPWLFILFLLWPHLIEALLSFQFSFVWGCLFGYLYVAAVEKGTKVQALIWWLLATTSHLVVIGPLLMLYNLFIYVRDKKRRQLILIVVGLSLPVLVLVAWYSLQAPSIGNDSSFSLVWGIAGVLFRRGSLFFLPFILMALHRYSLRRLTSISAAVVFICASLFMNLPVYSLSNLIHQADNPYREFLSNRSFEQGATFRILEADDREQGHYYLVKNGAVLAQELFGQSQERHSWERSEYLQFLTDKNIDYVIINSEYGIKYDTNEHQILEDMVTNGDSRILYEDPENRFNVFDVRQIDSYN